MLFDCVGKCSVWRHDGPQADRRFLWGGIGRNGVEQGLVASVAGLTHKCEENRPQMAVLEAML